MMPKDDQKHCPLFKLPPELRNRIYSCATSQSEAKEKPQDSELPLDNSNQHAYRDEPPYAKDYHSLPAVNVNEISHVKPSNALLGTCKRIYEEARAMFAASQRAFWRTNAFVFHLHDTKTASIPTAQDIVSRLHPKQIDAMPKFSVVMTMAGCLHTFHFVEDTTKTTEDETNRLHRPNCGFLEGGCSHTGDLSHAELRRRCGALGRGLLEATMSRPWIQAYDMKCRSASARNRVAAYEKSAQAYLGIASRGRELSKVEKHAMLRWEEERVRFTRELESQQVSMKRLMLNAVIEHLCGVF